MNMKQWWLNWKFWLVGLLLVSTFTRFFKLGDIQEYVFDEVYHAFTAKMYALDRYEAWVWWESPPDAVAYEWTHPPLAKVIMSWGIDMFGGPGELPTKVVDPTLVQTETEIESEKKSIKILTPQSFGWRFFSAAFGVLATFALFLLTSSLFKNKWIGLMAGFLFTFDLLPLVQSRTAMNDIFAVTFILFGLYFFTKRKSLLDYRLPWFNWLFAGAFVGCAIASKWTALFTIGILGAYQAATLIYRLFCYDQLHLPKPTVGRVSLLFGKQIGAGILSLLLLPFVIYMLSYWQLFTTPIYDYKGNSLNEALENKTWENELATLKTNQEQIKNTPETRSEFYKNKDKISETERKISFWQWLDARDDSFADRYYIWWGLQKQMWWYHTNLNATHNYTSQWWTWPLNIRPVWFYVKYCTNPDDRTDPICARTFDSNGGVKTIGDIYTMGNPFIFWLIFPTFFVLGYYMAGNYRVWLYSLIPASMFVLINYAANAPRGETQESMSIRAAQVFQGVLPQFILFTMLLLLFLILVRVADHYLSKKQQTEVEDGSLRKHFIDMKDAIPLLLCLIAFCSYWLPWARSPRIMFFYHFFPPVTFFYPLLAYVLYRIATHSKRGKYVIIVYCVLVATSFAYFYPHVTGWQVPENVREQYFWLKSWK